MLNFPTDFALASPSGGQQVIVAKYSTNQTNDAMPGTDGGNAFPLHDGMNNAPLTDYGHNALPREEFLNTV